jgi:hypothetical protein
LNPDIEAQQLLLLLKPFNAEKMEEWGVGATARNPINDYPEVISQLKAAGKELCFKYNEKSLS